MTKEHSPVLNVRHTLTLFQIAEVIKKLIKSSVFEWNQEGMEMIAPFLAAVPKSIIKDHADAQLLYDNRDLFTSHNFSMPQVAGLHNCMLVYMLACLSTCILAYLP